MKGSVLILVMFIMAAISMLIITSFTIAEAHYNITKNNNSYQEVYYLAESGMEFAHNELYNLILNVHNDCLNEFHWDPFHNPMQSMQESVRMFIENNLGPKINKTLQEKGYNLNFPVPVMPNLPSEAKLDIRIRFTDIYQNPSRLLISSRAELGKIRRRIDSVVYINKVSKIYDSFLFDKVLLIGKDIVVQNGGYLEANGKIHAQGELNILNNSTISLSKFSSFNQNITVSNNCSVTFNDDIIAYGLSVKGEYPSLIKCIKDLYLYSILSVNDSDNTIQIKGKLFICPEDISVPAGVVAANGGIVELEDEIYVNGTLQYESNEQYLFGMKHLPLQYGKYHSSESIGGGNYSFYFSKNISSDYANKIFTPDFLNLNKNEQTNIVYKYLTNPPDEENELDDYMQHIKNMNLENIHIKSHDALSGYTSGIICANNKVIAPLKMTEHEIFFKNLLGKMQNYTKWDYIKQINPYVSVPFSNTVINGNSLIIFDTEQPIICIIPEEKDIVLPSGKYKGLIMTNGSIHIPSKANIDFTGLLIANNNLFVEGNLTVKEDKNMILSLIGIEKHDSLRKLFRIESEKQLYEIISYKEVLYNQQW